MRRLVARRSPLVALLRGGGDRCASFVGEPAGGWSLLTLCVAAQVIPEGPLAVDCRAAGARAAECRVSGPDGRAARRLQLERAAGGWRIARAEPE